MKQSTKERLHRKWQKRYDKAWRRANYMAYGRYNEIISACNPWYYFKMELDGLKKLSKEYYNKKYVVEN